MVRVKDGSQKTWPGRDQRETEHDVVMVDVLKMAGTQKHAEYKAWAKTSFETASEALQAGLSSRCQDNILEGGIVCRWVPPVSLALYCM